MRFFSLAFVASAFILTGCGSAYRANDAAPASSARIAPASSFGGMNVKAMSCRQLKLEDDRLSAIGMAVNPSPRAMRAQQRLLNVRNARFNRCGLQSPAGLEPGFVAPLEGMVSADKISDIRADRQLRAASNDVAARVANSISIPTVDDYKKQMTDLASVSTAPPVIETKGSTARVNRDLAALPQTGGSSVIEIAPINSKTSASTVTTSTVRTGSGIQTSGFVDLNATTSANINESFSGRKFKTIVADGASVRVTTQSYEDLPLISGTEFGL